MVDLNIKTENYLKRIENTDTEHFGAWVKIHRNLFCLPFLTPIEKVIYQEIYFRIQEYGKSKISICHKAFLFLTHTSQSSVQKVPKRLAELGLIIIHPRAKARSVNTYSMPDSVTLFETIRTLNLEYIEKEKPNKGISQIANYINSNQKPFKKMNIEVCKNIKNNKRKNWRKEKRKITISTVPKSTYSETPETTYNDAGDNPLSNDNGKSNSTTRSKDLLHLLHKFKLYKAFQNLKYQALDLTDEQVSAFAEVAKSGRNPLGLFRHLIEHRSHAFEDDYVDPLTKYRQKKNEEEMIVALEQSRKEKESRLTITESLKDLLKESSLYTVYLDNFENVNTKLTESNIKFFIESMNKKSFRENKEGENGFHLVDREKAFFKLLTDIDSHEIIAKAELSHELELEKEKQRKIDNKAYILKFRKKDSGD